MQHTMSPTDSSGSRLATLGAVSSRVKVDACQLGPAMIGVSDVVGDISSGQGGHQYATLMAARVNHVGRARHTLQPSKEYVGAIVTVLFDFAFFLTSLSS